MIMVALPSLAEMSLPIIALTSSRGTATVFPMKTSLWDFISSIVKLGFKM